ncbi:MAG: glycoside hydrolase family 3 N-terminal domain-containing protein [Gaiellaceae bacterium]
MGRRAGAVLALALAAACACAGSAPARPAVSLARLAGETIMSPLTGRPSADFLARIRAGDLGGVILVGRWSSSAEMAAVTQQLQTAACTNGEPLLIGVDQEGGRVRRLPWAAPFDSPAALGRLDDLTRVNEEAVAAAASLRRAGVDVDFAPVADTPVSGTSFLGTRAFGQDPSLVGSLAGAFVQGLQTNGIAATAKHFPGLGASPANTDDRAVTIRAAAGPLEQGLEPFRSAVAAGAKLVMISSAAYPALDKSGRPAVFSRPIVTGLLRGSLGFHGVVVSDALDAPGAVRTPHATTLAIEAGVDVLLYTSDWVSRQGYLSLVQDAAGSSALRADLARARARIRALKAWLTAAGGPSCGGA